MQPRVSVLLLVFGATITVPLTPSGKEAAGAVVCQRGNRVKLRANGCKGKEGLVVDLRQLADATATEGPSGPQGPTGPAGPIGPPGSSDGGAGLAVYDPTGSEVGPIVDLLGGRTWVKLFVQSEGQSFAFVVETAGLGTTPGNQIQFFYDTEDCSGENHLKLSDVETTVPNLRKALGVAFRRDMVFRTGTGPPIRRTLRSSDIFTYSPDVDVIGYSECSTGRWTLDFVAESAIMFLNELPPVAPPFRLGAPLELLGE